MLTTSVSPCVAWRDNHLIFLAAFGAVTDNLRIALEDRDFPHRLLILFMVKYQK